MFCKWVESDRIVGISILFYHFFAVALFMGAWIEIARSMTAKQRPD